MAIDRSRSLFGTYSGFPSGAASENMVGVVVRVSSPVFVGRANELAVLDGVLQLAVGGHPATAVIAGEAGVGKTRLVAELVDRASGQGISCLSGACLNVGDDVLPLAPMAEVLRQLRTAFDESDLARVLGDGRTYLARLVPELGTQPGEHQAVDAEPATPGRMFELILGVVHRLAHRGPVLLVVEDLHWADRSTRDLLTFLVRNVRSGVLMLLTYRTDDLHRRHPLNAFLAELTRTRRVERIDLGRFTRRELVELLGGILDRPAPADVVDEIMARSEGNAFYAEELLAARRQGDAASRMLPDLVLARFHALTEPTQQLVAAAAVAGRRFAHELLSEVTEWEPETLAGRLHEAVDHRVLAIEGGAHGEAYAFRHALVQETIYRDLLTAQRLRLHAAYARAMSRRVDAGGRGDALAAVEAGQLAHHWQSAGDLDQALPAYVRAGVAADAATAPAEALRYFQRATEMWDKVPDAAMLSPLDRAALLERAAEAAYLISDYAQAVALARRALDHIDPTERTRTGALLARTARYHRDAGEPVNAIAAIERAIAMIPADPPSPERANVLAAAGRVLMLSNRFEQSRQRCQEAIAVARRVGARAAEGRALNTLGAVYGYVGRTSLGTVYLRRSLRIAEQLGSAEDLCRAHYNLAAILFNGARHEEAISVGLAGCRLARRLGLVRGYGSRILITTAGVLGLLARWADADRLLDEVLELDLPVVQRTWAIETRAIGRFRRGAFAGAAADVELCREMANVSDPDIVIALHLHDAELSLWDGRPADARAAVLDGLAFGADINPSVILELCSVGMAAEAAIVKQSGPRQTRRDDAVRRGASLLEHAHTAAAIAGPKPPHTVAAHLRTVEAEWTRVIGGSDPNAWTAAVHLWDTLEFPHQATYTRFRLAEALLGRGASRHDVGSVLAEGWRASHRFDLRSLAAELASLARRARIDLPTPPNQSEDRTGPKTGTRDPFGLTRREREVLLLVADGNTNRQIAEKLYISDKTASVHVSNIIGKLVVSNRGEAAAMARRLGLLK